MYNRRSSMNHQLDEAYRQGYRDAIKSINEDFIKDEAKEYDRKLLKLLNYADSHRGSIEINIYNELEPLNNGSDETLEDIWPTLLSSERNKFKMIIDNLLKEYNLRVSSNDETTNDYNSRKMSGSSRYSRYSSSRPRFV